MTIVVIVAFVVFTIGGLILARFGNKISEKMREEETKKNK